MEYVASQLIRDPSRKTSSQSCTGEFNSLTTGGRLIFESAGERDLLIMLDVDWRTIELACQPDRWRVHNGRRWTSYVPDVYAASLHGERYFFQVKRAEQLASDPTLNGRIDAIDTESRRHGAEHRFCPREALRIGARMANSNWVHGAATALHLPLVRRVAAVLADFRPPQPLGVLRRAGLDADLRNALIGMIGHREAAADLDVPLNDDGSEVLW